MLIAAAVILIMTIGVILHARRRRRRRMVWIPFNAAVALSTLANNAAIAGSVLTFGEDFFMVGMKATWTMDDNTTGENPLDVGFAHGDLSVSEILEAIDASQADPDDIIAVERARRPVRKVGTFSESVLTKNTLNDGKAITTRFKRSIGDGHALDLFAVNRSGATLTTGTRIIVDGHLYGRWQR